MSKTDNKFDNLSDKELTIIKAVPLMVALSNVNITRKTIDILIDRHTQSSESTLGTISIPKFNFDAYTLERAGPDTTTRGQKKKFPIGTYQVRWHATALNQ